MYDSVDAQTVSNLSLASNRNIYSSQLERVQQRLGQPLAAGLEGTCADLGTPSVVEETSTLRAALERRDVPGMPREVLILHKYGAIGWVVKFVECDGKRICGFL